VSGPSSPVEDHYDVLVVGSGFGGAVAACRSAQAGRRVAILERGRRYGRGEFPRAWDDPWFWAQGGPFDIRPFGEVTTVSAAGYGGGSLLYSNVHLRVPTEGFARGWPDGWSREALDPYYDLVAHMLALAPVGRMPTGELPARTRRMAEAACTLGRDEDFFLPTQAVSFGPPGETFTNAYDRTQTGCSHCGECSIGCNQHAKNSLDLTYLARAEDAGATVGLRCEVRGVRPVDGGYAVTFTDHAQEVDREVRAEVVVLAAGALGTTELLLRCRDEGLLGHLSDRLGERYSANGDLMAFALGTDEPWEPASGPAITAAVRYAEGDGPDDPWFLVQDGGVPPPFASAAVAGLRGVDWLEDWLGGLLPGGENAWIDRLWQLDGQDDEADPQRLAIFLAMGRDSSDGVVRLLDLPGRPAWLEWSVARNQRLANTEQRLVEEFASAMGADPVSNPAWRFLRVPVSVHNLGGAVMAQSAAEGVVDPHGEVHGHPGLFVLDGAALPRATGVNPSHTITAMAERNIEHLLRRWSPGWCAPEWPAVDPDFHDPLPPTPATGTRPPRSFTTGLRTRVGLHGALALVEGGGLLRLDAEGLDVVVDALRDLLDPAGDPVSVGGRVRLGGAWPDQEFPLGAGLVTRGTPTRWALPFGAGAASYVLTGWSTGCTVRLTLRAGPDPAGPPIAFGVARLDPWPALGATRLVGRPVRALARAAATRLSPGGGS
jgi:cholesterol oxidase